MTREAGADDALVKDLGATPTEIARQLSRLEARYPSVPGACGAPPAGFRLPAGGAAALTFEPGPERRIGGLAIPTTRVTLRFDGAQQHERAQFVADFLRVTQRGGG